MVSRDACNCDLLCHSPGTECYPSRLRPQRISRRRQSQNSASDFFLHRILAEQSSGRESEHVGRTSRRSRIRRIRISRALQRPSLRAAENGGECHKTRAIRRQAAATPPRAAKAFPPRPLFFSIRNKVDACCPSRKLTSSPGSMALPQRASALAFIVRAFRRPTTSNVVTAEDIRQSAGKRDIVYWAINDACPPAPGCVFPPHPPAPSQSGVAFAEVWQFAQSPQRKDVAGRCTNYSRDGNCYPPGMNAAQGLHIDVNSATFG